MNDKIESLRCALQGIVPPLITPLLANVQGQASETDDDTVKRCSVSSKTATIGKRRLSIDVQGTRNLIEHVIDGGVSAIFAFGSTGEGPSLSQSLRYEFVRLVCDLVKGRVPVLVGIIGTCMDDILQDAAEYQKAGASALVLTAPFYFTVTQNELFDWCWQVYGELDPSMPLVLYNMPGLTKIWFQIETIEKLLLRDAQSGNPPRIVGIKDSSADLDYFAKLCNLKKKSFMPSQTIV